MLRGSVWLCVWLYDLPNAILWAHFLKNRAEVTTFLLIAEYVSKIVEAEDDCLRRAAPKHDVSRLVDRDVIQDLAEVVLGMR